MQVWKWKTSFLVQRHFNAITWQSFKNEIDDCPLTAGSRGVVCNLGYLCKNFSWSRLERQPASAGEIYRLAIELSTFRQPSIVNKETRNNLLFLKHFIAGKSSLAEFDAETGLSWECYWAIPSEFFLNIVCTHNVTISRSWGRIPHPRQQILGKLKRHK